MKPSVLIYCIDGMVGAALAKPIRDGSSNISICSAADFRGAEGGSHKVIIAPDVPAWRRDAIRTAYGMAPEIPRHDPAAAQQPAIKRKPGRPRKAAA